MRPLVLVLALLVAACKCDDRLIPSSDCGKPCYPDHLQDAGVGQCKMGVLSCNDDETTECVGFGSASEEVCDLADNDCNGAVDDILANPRLCSSVCGMGIEQCVSGRWTTCSAATPQPEICNGRDDDCDGRVDEASDVVWVLPDGGATTNDCYTGPLNSESLGICHAGSNRCVAGKTHCYGDQTPRGESCNGLDDDCDGEIDEGAAPNDKIDFVLVFDNSGSMAMVAATLKLATETWVTKYSGLTERHYALVAAPDNALFVTVPTKVQDFSDPATFNAAVQLQTGYTGSGQEPTLDAIYDLIDPANPLQMDWRPGSMRVIVMFSDEEPQAYQTQSDGYQTNLNEMAGRLLLSGYVFHAFTILTPSYRDPWGVLATAGGGQVWDIEAGPAELEEYLDNVIKKVSCQP